MERLNKPVSDVGLRFLLSVTDTSSSVIDKVVALIGGSPQVTVDARRKPDVLSGGVIVTISFSVSSGSESSLSVTGTLTSVQLP